MTDNDCGDISNIIPIDNTRCWTCKKKLKLFRIQCKCNYYFCSVHRYSDTHNCSFDYKTLGKNNIFKENPKIRVTKI